MAGTGKTREQYLAEIKLLQNSGAPASEINKLRGEYLNNANKPNTVAAEINQLRQQGASDEQISTFVTSRGYSEQDFNIDQEGKFRPMEGTRDASSGRVLGVDYDRPTSQDIADQRAFDRLDAGLGQPSNLYYENSTASAAVIGNKPGTTVVTTTTTNFQQVSGGGSTTTYRIPPQDTSDSLAAKQDAARAETLQQAYQLNPNDTFDKNILNEQLSAGKITQNQYNDIVNSTPEQRDQKSLQYAQQYQQARERQSATQFQYDPVVVTVQAPNSSSITVVNETTVAVTPAVQNSASGTTTATTATTSAVDVATGTAAPSATRSTPVLESAQTFPVEPQPIITSTPIVTSAQPLQVETDTGLTDATAATDAVVTAADPNFVPVARRVSLPQTVDTTLLTQSSGSEGLLENAIELQETERAQNEARIREIEESAERGILADRSAAKSGATRQDVQNAKALGDWRVRISLASESDYFYNSLDNPGILAPLYDTDGVIFPYTPSISVSYSATYDQQTLTHSNYKTTQYTGSSVDNIVIGCDFTAQDTYEANYLLATIHFFRTLTKMFYGQDQNPPRGTPPPLCYLHGYGEFQFNKHPLVITNFNYSLPTDVDYIRTDTNSYTAGQPLFTQTKNKRGTAAQTAAALRGLVSDSGTAPQFITSKLQPTYVPTRVQISITAAPVVSRYDSSNLFSLRDYASGQLLRGNQQKWGGFW